MTTATAPSAADSAWYSAADSAADTNHYLWQAELLLSLLKSA
jgi:ubiquinone biosynthesis protein COQ9